jgi:predicted secreted hydrolase
VDHPHTQAVYPSGWEARVPGLGLELELVPTLDDQELATTGTTGLAYWEGQVEARGRRGVEPVAGLGYVELTGYAPTQPRTASTSSRAATSASAASP